MLALPCWSFANPSSTGNKISAQLRGAGGSNCETSISFYHMALVESLDPSGDLRAADHEGCLDHPRPLATPVGGRAASTPLLWTL